jgi:nucleoside-diphosphate-sugar epimerase
MKRILVTGALGQIGSELVAALRTWPGVEEVVASDIRMPPREQMSGGAVADNTLFELVDCTHIRQISDVVRRHDIDTVYHLAALLSAVAEEKPRVAWEINMGGLYRVLEVGRQHDLKIFFPSSIGAFGPGTPKDNTPQDTLQRPSTIYGITKVSGELLCDYYHSRFGVDTRGLRLPGLISYGAPPGGGTTDWAVEIFYQALRYQHYNCFVREDSQLDMMYMPDAVRAMIEVMAADADRLVHRNAFNVTAMSLTPRLLADEIRKHIPDFEIEYQVDPQRQAIADSWPRSLDDSAARKEWGWRPAYDLSAMTADMLDKLGEKLTPGRQADPAAG